MLMEITFRQLKYLTSLAEIGHFGRAAAAVNISQPALSVQIRQLETALGTALVERGARETVLTPAGHEVLRRARLIQDELREMRQVARWARGLDGRLRLGVIPTVAPYLLPTALPMLRARNLAIDLGVREAPTAALIEELRQGALDAAVIALPGADAEMVERPIFHDRFLLAGSQARLAALGTGRAGLRPQDMDPGHLLLLDDGHCLADQAIAACAIDRTQARIDLRAASLTTLCRLASEGFGLTLLPEIAIRAECAAAPALRLAAFETPEPGRQIGLVRRRLTADDGWFGELAGILAQAASVELAAGSDPDRAAARLPP